MSTAATNVVFQDTPDPLTNLLTGSVGTTAGTVALGNGAGDSTVQVNVGTVPATGVPISITFQVSITNPLPAGVLRIRNQGVIAAGNAPGLVTDDPDVVGAEDPTLTLVTSAPLLTGAKSASLIVDADLNGQPSPGDTVFYQITVRNQGNGPATGVHYSDVLDPNMTLVVGSVQASPGTVVHGNTDGDKSVQVDLFDLGGGGQTAQVSYRAVIVKPLPAGVENVTNQGVVTAENSAAVLTDDPNVSGPNDPTVVQVVASARLVSTKRAILDVDADGDGIFSPGDTVLYLVTISNLGNRAATTVVYSDTVDANTTLINNSVATSTGAIQRGRSSGDTNIQIAIGTLPGGVEINISYRVLIDDPLPAGVASIRNQGRVTSREEPLVLTDDPEVTGPADATVLPVTSAPLMNAFKTEALFSDNDDNGVLSPGDTVIYQVLVNNIGNGEATNVVYEDTPDPNTTLVNGSVETNRGTVTSGNNSGEQTIRVDMGNIPGRGRAGRISYLVTVNNPLPSGVMALRNQGRVTSTQLPPLLTDDSNTVAAGDATIAPLALGGIGGTVFNDINGTGVQGEFEPELAGVQVTIRDSSNNVITTVVTGANGTYLVEGLTPGAYVVEVATPANFFATTPSTVPVNVPSIGNVTVNVGFQEKGTVSGVVFNDDNGNGIFNTSDAPLINVSVQLFQNGSPVASTTTDGAGYFQFTGIISGSYTVVETDLAGFVSTTPNEVPVSVGPGGVASVRFGDQQVGSISGVVFADFNGNGAQDVGELPLEGVTIALRDSGGAQVATATTDVNGFYEFSNVTPGNYELLESDPAGYVSTTPNLVPVALIPNGAPNVNFGDQQTGTVSGVVYDDNNSNGLQDADEQGIAGVTILLDLGGGNISTTVSGPNGGYLFEEVTPGSFAVVTEVDPDGYISTTPNQVPVNIAPGSAATANFGDQQVGTISGKVFDDHDGDGVNDPAESGIAGVLVTLLNAQGNEVATTTTAGNGGYIFLNLPSGGYTVVETDPSSYASTTVNEVGVFVAPGGAGVANFGDRPVGSISGVQFNDLNGDGIQNGGEPGIGAVTITLVDAQGDTVAETVTSGNGSYLFTNIPTGQYTVVAATIPGYVDTTPNEIPVVLIINSAVTANFGDQQTGTISGVVFNDINANGVNDGSESGLGGVTVRLRNNGTILATTTTSGDGSYIFTGVNTGSYTIEEIDLPGFLSTTNNKVAVSLPPGGAGSANFGDIQQGAISGVVFNDLNGNGVQDADEPGIGGVVITLDLGSGGQVTTTTATNGSYQFSGLTPGSYAVIVEQDPVGFVSTTPNQVPVNIPPGGSGNANFGDQPVGSISGEVYVDINANGIPEGSETTLGGVTITLRNSQGDVVATTTTTVNGTYQFTNIPAGNYVVEETDPVGFTSTTLNQVAILLPAGGAGSANFGDLPIGTVAGVEFNDLNGNGNQDPGETGIGGVTIELVNSQGGVVAAATTSGNGTYQFLDVVAGSYTVRAGQPDGFVSTTPNQVSVAVTSNGQATANFGEQQTGAVSGVVFNDLNGNGIQDSGEPGIGGVVVTLNLGGGGQITTTTTINGSYLFNNLTPGSYTVVIEQAPVGFVSTTPTQVPVNIPPGGAGVANFGDQPVGSVSGVQFNDLNGDGTQNSGELGIGGITISLVNAQGDTVAQAVTSGNGAYLFTTIPAGNYTVVAATIPGYIDTTPNEIPVVLVANSAVTANFGDQQTGTISGAVFNDINGNGESDASESGLGGVIVRLRDNGTVLATTTTSGDGNYIFSNLTPGSYTIEEVDLPGFLSTTSNKVAVSLPAGGAGSANFGDQQTGTISGVVFNDLNGNGIQDPDEPGLGGVVVVLDLGSGGRVTTTTATNGNYHFDNLTPGSYAVVIEQDPPGFVSTTPNQVPVNIPPGGAGSANFGDRQIGTIGGEVYVDINANGNPESGETTLGGVTITLRNSQGDALATTVTTVNGTYVFTNVPAGNYRVEETDPVGFTSTTLNRVTINLPAGGAAVANFGDLPVGIVSGVQFNDTNGNSIQDLGESGIGGVTIELVNSQGTVVATATTNGNGTYQFLDVPEGTYTVRAGQPDGFVSTSPDQVSIVVSSNGHATANFGDQQTGSISGVVFNDLNGNGVQDFGEPGIGGVVITLDLGSGGQVTTTTTGNGSYLFSGLTPGGYAVIIEQDPSGFVSTTPNQVPVNIPPGGSGNANFGDYQIGTIGGEVFVDINADGIPENGETKLGGVTITLRNSQGNVVATTTTTLNGTYLFTSITAGSYVVEETDPLGFVSTTLNQVAITLPAGGAATANFGDLPVGIVAGVQYNDLNGNSVQDQGEPGINGVTIELVNGQGAVIATATTRGGGDYQFLNVVEGSYTVRAGQPSGFLSTTPNQVSVAVTSNGQATANFGDQQTGSISGVVFNDTNGNGVQDAGETGISGVTVQLETESGTVVDTALTTGAGGYSFSSLAPGSYRVVETTLAGFTSTSPDSVSVFMPPGGVGNANFGEMQQGAISGVVFNDTNGNGGQDAAEPGLSGVVVTLLNTQGNVLATTTTTLNGGYLFNNLIPGNYTVVEADPSGYVSTTVNQVLINVPPGGSGVANFGDQPVGSVSGVEFNDLNGDGIHNGGEVGIGGVSIALVNAQGDTVAETETSGNGSYLFTNVPAGQYTVVAGAISGYVDTTPNVVPVVLIVNSAVTANFGDQQTGTISGVVYNDVNANGASDVSENGLGGVTVRLRNNGAILATTTTSGDGGYIFSNLIPGTYTVEEIDLPGFLSSTSNNVAVSLPAGGAGSANFGDLQQGAISGVVFNDLNANGLQEPEEPGLGGVVVTLDLGSGGQVTTTTNVNGSYLFNNLTPGNYAVVIEQDPAGFVSTTPNQVPINVPPGGAGVANFGDRQIGTIGGEVYLDINANGIPDSGEATLGGVTITLRNSQGDVVATTTTTVNGTYVFTNIPAGNYTVEETDPAGFTSTTQNQVAITLPGGGAGVANFGDQAVGSVSGVEFNDLNGNGLQNLGEAGIGGVIIELVNSQGAVVGTTTTSGNGNYQFLDVVAGAYIVRASQPVGFVSTTSNQVSVAVTNDSPATANFGDQQTGSVSGVVFNDLNGNGIQDPDEPGIGGVVITLDLGNGGQITTTTTVNGSYLFTDLPPGSHAVIIEQDPPGFVSTTPNQVPVNVPPGGAGSANFGDRQIGTIGGEVYIDINANGAPESGETALGGVTITLRNSQGDVVATTTTNVTGAYLFTNVPPGNYVVEETDPAGFTSTTLNQVAITLPAGGAATANFGDLPVGTVAGVEFNDLNGNGNQDLGEPGIGGVTIELVNSQGTVLDTITTNGNGTYQFVDVAAGSYTVRAGQPDGFVSTTPDQVSVAISSNGQATANFGEQQTGAITGVVYHDLNGNGVQDFNEPGLGGVSVRLETNTRAGLGSTLTTGSGAYVFPNLPAGNYRVVETTPEGFTSTTPDSVPVILPAGGAGSANFGEVQQGAISGVVFNDANGNGVQEPEEPGLGGVVVTLNLEGGGQLATTTTLNGGYSFSNLIPGNYTVVETDPTGYASTTLNEVGVFVPPAGAGIANFGDQPIGTVSGVEFNDLNGNGLQDLDEPGIGGVAIALVNAQGDTVAQTVTSGNGAYLFTNVPAGQYTVVAAVIPGFIDTTPNVVQVVLIANSAVTANFGDQQTATISGVVYNDTNANGVVDINENGLGGVTVRLHSNGAVIATTTTSGDGSYLFTGINAGSYIVEEVDLPGFLSTTSNNVAVSLPAGGAGVANFGDQQTGAITGVVFNDLNGNSIQDPDEPGLGGVVITLNVDDGGQITTATSLNGNYIFDYLAPGNYTVIEADPAGFVSTTTNQVLVNIPPGGAGNANFGDHQIGAIAGEVYIDTNANGIPESGETTLGGVTITLRNRQGDVVATTTTTVNGGYLFTNVPPGNYIVEESDPAGFTSTTLNQVAITLPAGGAAIANFGDLPIGTVVGVEYNDLNSNGSQDLGEPGIGGVTIELVNNQGTVVATTTTSGNGAYQFLDVTAGAYTVRAGQPDGFVSTTPDIVPVIVSNDGPATANFGDVQQGAITGVVFNDLNGNGVQDFGEPGLGGVIVRLETDNGAVVSTTVTTGAGGYIFPDLDTGNYRVVEITPEGFVSTTPDTVPVVLPPGGAGNANFGDRELGVISGVVFYDINSDGRQGSGEEGLAGIVIELLDGDGNVILQTQSNVGGFYLFTDLAAGNYSVREQQPAGFVDTTPNSVAVTLPAGGSGTVNFGEKLVASVSGVVFYDSNANGIQEPNEPGIGGVKVELLGTNGTIIAITATTGDGSYLFMQVDPGDYTVLENDPTDYLSTTPNEVAINVPPGGSATANFGDRQIGLIEGLVFLDADSDTVLGLSEGGFGGIVIELLDSNGNVIATTVSSSQGSYLFADIDPGDYTVRIGVPDNYTATTSNVVAVTVPPNGIGTANFGLNAVSPVEVGGIVWYDFNEDGLQDNPESEPGVPDVTVTLFNTATESAYIVNSLLLTTTTPASGSYLFTNLPPGDYYVVFDLASLPPGYAPTLSNQSNDESVDSDVDDNGRSDNTGFLNAGESDLTMDLGISVIDLQLLKEATTAQVQPGDLLTYRLTYTSSGSMARDVFILESVPEHTTFVATGSTPGWSCADGAAAGTECRLELGDLSRNTSGTATFIVRVDNPLSKEVRTISNQATIGNARGELDPTIPDNEGEETTTVNPPTALEPVEQPTGEFDTYLPTVQQEKQPVK